MSLTLPPLPYALDALEPHVSRRTLGFHHGHHHAGYVQKTRALVRTTPLESASLAEIVRVSATETTHNALFNAAAQAWNHEFFWQSMRRGGGGKIVNIADWAGLRPYANYLPYVISKGGIVTMTKALAKELAPEIEVNAIAPGPVMLPEDFEPDAAERIRKGTLLKRLGSPEDVARSVVFLVAMTDFVTGHVLVVDGGRLIA